MNCARIDKRSLFALCGEWLLIACAMLVGVSVDQLWLYLLTGLVIASRQHALLILFHDAVHGQLAKHPQLNDALINGFIGIPALLPVEIYRPLHLLHHRTIGTDEDPERLLLYADQAWNYRPLRGGTLVLQMIGDLLLINGIRAICAWTKAGHHAGLQAMTVTLAVVWIGTTAAAVFIAPDAALRALLLWFIPLLTVTQLLQKLRSYAEHSGGPNVTRGWPHWTYSWRVGPVGRMTVWPYNINYHREHHDQPGLRWHELPGAQDPAIDRLAGSQLWSLLYRPRSS